MQLSGKMIFRLDP